MKVIKVSDEVHYELSSRATDSIGNYIRDLLNNSKPQSDTSLDRVEAMLEELLAIAHGVSLAPVRPSSSPQEPSLAAPGTDIKFDDMPASVPLYAQYRKMAEEYLPEELQAKLEFCQDRETRNQISAEYQKEIDSYWALYHESKPS